MIESGRFVKNDLVLGEIQRLRVAAHSGNFSITYSGFTTDPLNIATVTPKQIRIALAELGLDALKITDVLVTEEELPFGYTPPRAYERRFRVEFMENLADVDVPTLVLNSVSLSSPILEVTQIRQSRSLREEYAFHDDATPFEEFTTEVDWREEDIPRAQEHGSIGSFPFMGKRITRVSGDLLADSPEDYWDRRLEMLGLFTPVRGKTVLGTLYLDFAGVSEELMQDVSLDGYPELPIEALSPSAGKYMIAFKSNDPRLYGTTEKKIPAVGRYGNAVLTNEGNTPSPHLMVVMSNEGYNPRITHLETGAYVEASGIKLSANDILIIDFLHKHIKHFKADTGETIVRHKTAGNWFELIRGTNTLTFEMVSDTNINEIQKLIMYDQGYVAAVTPGGPTSQLDGEYTLTFDGQTTGNLSIYSDASAVSAALDALSNVAPGDITVVEDLFHQISFPPFGGKQYKYAQREFSFHFGGNYEATDVPQIEVTPIFLDYAEMITVQEAYTPDENLGVVDYYYRNAYLI